MRPPASTLATAFALAAVVLLAAFAAPAQMPPTGEFPKTDFERRIVDLSEIMSGGPPRDGIPAIDEPRHASTEDAGEWLDPDEPVIAAEIDGEARAYPLQILIWHEIANDSLGGTPIAVTFCPLCNSAIVFDRRLDGEVLRLRHDGAVAPQRSRHVRPADRDLVAAAHRYRPHRRACGTRARPPARRHRLLARLPDRVSGRDGAFPRDRTLPALRLEPLHGLRFLHPTLPPAKHPGPRASPRWSGCCTWPRGEPSASTPSACSRTSR